MWCICEWRGGEETQHNEGWIKENFRGKAGTLISHSCLNKDPFPAKPKHLIFTQQQQYMRTKTALGQINTYTADATLGSCSQSIRLENARTAESCWIFPPV